MKNEFISQSSKPLSSICSASSVMYRRDSSSFKRTKWTSIDASRPSVPINDSTGGETANMIDRHNRNIRGNDRFPTIPVVMAHAMQSKKSIQSMIAEATKQQQSKLNVITKFKLHPHKHRRKQVCKKNNKQSKQSKFFANLNLIPAKEASAASRIKLVNEHQRYRRKEAESSTSNRSSLVANFAITCSRPESVSSSSCDAAISKSKNKFVTNHDYHFDINNNNNNNNNVHRNRTSKISIMQSMLSKSPFNKQKAFAQNTFTMPKQKDGNDHQVVVDASNKPKSDKLKNICPAIKTEINESEQEISIVSLRNEINQSSKLDKKIKIENDDFGERELAPFSAATVSSTPSQSTSAQIAVKQEEQQHQQQQQPKKLNSKKTNCKKSTLSGDPQTPDSISLNSLLLCDDTTIPLLSSFTGKYGITLCRDYDDNANGDDINNNNNNNNNNNKFNHNSDDIEEYHDLQSSSAATRCDIFTRYRSHITELSVSLDSCSRNYALTLRFLCDPAVARRLRSLKLIIHNRKYFVPKKATISSSSASSRSSSSTEITFAVPDRRYKPNFDVANTIVNSSSVESNQNRNESKKKRKKKQQYQQKRKMQKTKTNSKRGKDGDANNKLIKKEIKSDDEDVNEAEREDEYLTEDNYDPQTAELEIEPVERALQTTEQDEYGPFALIFTLLNNRSFRALEHLTIFALTECDVECGDWRREHRYPLAYTQLDLTALPALREFYYGLDRRFPLEIVRQLRRDPQSYAPIRKLGFLCPFTMSTDDDKNHDQNHHHKVEDGNHHQHRPDTDIVNQLPPSLTHLVYLEYPIFCDSIFNRTISTSSMNNNNLNDNNNNNNNNLSHIVTTATSASSTRTLRAIIDRYRGTLEYLHLFTTHETSIIKLFAALTPLRVLRHLRLANASSFDRQLFVHRQHQYKGEEEEEVEMEEVGDSTSSSSSSSTSTFADIDYHRTLPRLLAVERLDVTDFRSILSKHFDLSHHFDARTTTSISSPTRSTTTSNTTSNTTITTLQLISSIFPRLRRLVNDDYNLKMDAVLPERDGALPWRYEYRYMRSGLPIKRPAGERALRIAAFDGAGEPLDTLRRLLRQSRCAPSEIHYLVALEMTLDARVAPPETFIRELSQLRHLQSLFLRCPTDYFDHNADWQPNGIGASASRKSSNKKGQKIAKSKNNVARLHSLRHLQITFSDRFESREPYAVIPNRTIIDAIESFSPMIEELKFDGIRARKYNIFRLSRDELRWFANACDRLHSLRRIWLLKDCALQDQPPMRLPDVQVDKPFDDIHHGERFVYQYVDLLRSAATVDNATSASSSSSSSTLLSSALDTDHNYSPPSLHRIVQICQRAYIRLANTRR